MGRQIGGRDAIIANASKEVSAVSFVTVGEELVALTTPQDVARLARTIELTRTTVGHNLNQVLRALRLRKQWRAN